MKCLIFIFLGGKIVAPLKSNGLNKKNVHFLVFMALCTHFDKHFKMLLHNESILLYHITHTSFIAR